MELECKPPSSAADTGNVPVKPESCRKGDFAISKIPENERIKFIARRAYELYEKRGFAAGYDVEDWLKAESEIDQCIY